MYNYSLSHPEKHPEVIQRIRGLSNVSIPYVRGRVEFFAGESLENLRKIGKDCFEKHYSGKMYGPMRALIDLLKRNNFEIWIITASPEGLYQEFLSEELNIGITNIVGVKSVVRDGIVTDRIIEPVPQDEGKKESIETFVQARPLFSAGNSRGDREMIEYSAGMKMIINPDEHIAQGDQESMAETAGKLGWAVVHIPDEPEKDFPAVSSTQFQIRLNKTHSRRD